MNAVVEAFVSNTCVGAFRAADGNFTAANFEDGIVSSKQ
jgi:hypothetical protein